jgi:AcrR family transcriptional regulator
MSESTRGSSRLPREQRVAGLLDAARAVFAEKGYDGASVSEIAERVGVVEGNIYRHFESKRALLVRVVEEWYEAMISDYDEHLKGIEGTRNRLRYMIWRHLSTIEKEPALCRLMFGEIRSGSDYRKTTIYRLNSEYTRRTMDILKEGIDAGELRGDVPLRLVRDMIYGCIEHHTWAFLRREGTFDPAASADAITEIVYAGLLAPSAPRLDQRLEVLVRRLERAADRLEGTPREDHVREGSRRKPR